MSNSINEAFENVITAVDNVKSNLATAITQKGIQTNSTDTFAKMTENVGKITSNGSDGKKYGVGDVIKNEDVEVILKDRILKNIWWNSTQNTTANKFITDLEKNIILMSGDRITKINSKTNKVLKTFVTPNNETIRDFCITKSGKVFICYGTYIQILDSDFDKFVLKDFQATVTAVAADNSGSIYVGYADGGIQKLNSDLTSVWKKKHSNYSVYRILFNNQQDKVFYFASTIPKPSVSQNGEVIRINTSGDKEKQKKFPTLSTSLFCIDKDDCLYIDYYRNLAKLDSNLEVVWEDGGSGNVRSASISNENEVYMVNKNNVFMKIDKKNGNETEQFALGSDLSATIIHVFDEKNIFMGVNSKTAKYEIEQKKEYKVLR